MADTFSQSSLQLKLGRDCGLYWLDALPTTATPYPQPHTQMLQLWDQEGKAWQLCRCKEPSSGVTVAAQAVAAPRPQSQAPAAAPAQPAAPVSLCPSAFSSQGAPCAGEEWIPSSCSHRPSGIPPPTSSTFTFPLLIISEMVFIGKEDKQVSSLRRASFFLSFLLVWTQLVWVHICSTQYVTGLHIVSGTTSVQG